MIILKMAAMNYLQRCIAFQLRIINDPIGIQKYNPMHLGKKFLAAIFSLIVYFKTSDLDEENSVIYFKSKSLPFNEGS